MKKIDNVFKTISSKDNIVSAATKAKKGKKRHRGVRNYEKHKDEYHDEIQKMLQNKTYKVSEYEKMEKLPMQVR